MLIETCLAVRAMVGTEYPILIKINSNDAIKQGMTFEECKYVCRKLEEAEVEIPIILVGGNREYSAMDTILNETSIEYFSLSRPFIAESDFISRWENGDTGRVKCISCNSCNTPKSMGRCILKEDLASEEN